MFPLALVVFALLSAPPPRCVARGLLPDPQCTTGEVDPALTRAEVCGRPTRARRRVPASVRAAVLRAYGVPAAEVWRYEVDHLVSLEVGGANSLANLWPQPIQSARRKDVIENWLHREVCTGRMAIQDAQNRLANDWTTAEDLRGLP